MYPCIPCGNCGGPIQFLPQLAGCGVICPHCGVTVQMPGGDDNATLEPDAAQDVFAVGVSQPSRPMRVRRRREAPIWPGIMLGSGMAVMLYFGFLRDSRWLVVQLAYEGESVGAALWRQFSASIDSAALSGLSVGGITFLFGAACFVLGRKTK